MDFNTFINRPQEAGAGVSSQQQVDVCLQQNYNQQRPLQEQIEARHRQDVCTEKVP